MDLIHLDPPSSAMAAAVRPIRYLILCGVLLIAAIAFVTAMTIFNFRDRALAHTQRELQNMALVLAAKTNSVFETIEHVQTNLIDRIQSRGITSSEDFERKMSGYEVHLMLKDKRLGLPHVSTFTLINAQGKLFNFSRFWPIPDIDVSDRDFFKAFQSVESRTFFISDPIQNRATGTWVIQFARKITAPNGEFVGLLLAAIELEHFEKEFQSFVLGEYGSISLQRSNGVLLARFPRIESIIGSSFTYTIDQLEGRGHDTVRVVDRMDGKDRLLAVHRLASYPFLISVGMEVGAALSDWQHEIQFLIGLALFSAALVAVVFFPIVRQLLRGHKWSRQRLALEKLRLNTAVNNMSQGLLLFDSSERIVVCNQRYIEMYGLSPDVVKPGCTFRDLIYHRKETGSFSGDVDKYCSAVLSSFVSGPVAETIIKTVDGRSIRILNQLANGGGWVSTHEDITVQRNAEQELDRNQKFLNLILENAPAPIFVKEASELRYVLVNGAGEKFWGISRATMIGKTAYDIFGKKEADLIAARDAHLLQSDQPTIDERQIHTPSNGIRSIMSKRLVVRDDEGKPQYLIGVIEDVTERRHAEERIAHMAHYDALTDLPNRVLFREQLEQALKWVHRGDSLAVLYLDLDLFKSVNDSLGHPVGDELLKAVATRLRGCLRETDIVARLGGDEFAIIQGAVAQPTDVINLVNRIHEAIREPYEAGGHQLVADISIGIAMAPDDGTDPNQLLKNADLAMYGAKLDGRGTYRFFEPDMDARVKARRALEFDLREAIMCGGFELYYQPLVNLRDNKITGCEALLRWHHPKRGMVSPAEFIAIAEETGLITVLGEWVLRTACAEVATWPDDIKVAVNVSPVQFKNGNFVQMVINALAASRLPARRLELEITEAVLIRDDKAALAVLHQLRALGVRIAMDDFGTGYSSLSYLQRFPFDKIKIDRCFITDIAETDGSLSIVQAVVGIATARNITTTAEGVETEQQLELLRVLGCTEMQGYVFSPAIPAAEISELLLSRSERPVAVA